MHSCETLDLSQSSMNSHCWHPAGPPHTAQFNSKTSAQAWCLTPRPLAQRAVSFTSIFFFILCKCRGISLGWPSSSFYQCHLLLQDLRLGRVESHIHRLVL